MGRVSGNALVSFQGTTVDESTTQLVSNPKVAGVMLYRMLNIESSDQTRDLIDELKRAAGKDLLVAVDQEGGQLLGAGADTTPFAGNMALGAAGDTGLTRKVASAIGRELRALGVSIDLAPVADVASRPYNPSMGIRSFGEDPNSVAAMTAAFVEGIQSVGVAATLKHFPGKGEATTDPHDVLPVLDLDLERLERVEFAPFRSGIEAGAHLVMVGHYGLPAVTGDRDLPTSVSPETLSGLIRDKLGFPGLIVTDALDMGGFGGREPDAPLAAGADLLLYGPAQSGMVPVTPPNPSRRLNNLGQWLASFGEEPLTSVGGGTHQRLATELARRSITLVKDEAGLIRTKLHRDQKILALMPRPTNLTPADTSSLVVPGLAASIRRHHENTREIVFEFDPTAADIAALATEARQADHVVVGTLDANSGQGVLVEALLDTGVPTVVVAMRTPYDLVRFPRAQTYLCCYGILPPTMDALGDALFGAPISGRLPVAIPDLFPVGHGLALTS